MRIRHNALLTAVVGLSLGAVLGIALLWPSDAPRREVDDFGPATRLLNATLVDVESHGQADIAMMPGATEITVSVRIDDTGEIVTFDMVDETGDTFAAGQGVRLQEFQGYDDEVAYLISDFRRDWSLVALAGLFLAAVVGFGRLQGLRAVVGLGLTFLLIVTFTLPAILDGRSPVPVALVSAVAIMIVTLYLSHGYSPKTTAAVVGTALALGITGVLAAAFVAAAQLTGFTSEEARLANLEVGGLSLRGLLLAGIIIGGLGVLDDVTMSQSSTVFELHRANPRAGFASLVRGALNVGRDHVAATVNTLFLAYAGAALPLLILFVVGSDSVATVVTSEIVAVEVVRTLVGSIGLIAAVPLTTALAAGLVAGAGRGATTAAEAGVGEAGGTQAPAGGAEAPAGGAQAAAGGAEAPAGGPEVRPEDAADGAWVQRLREAYELPDDRADG